MRRRIAIVACGAALGAGIGAGPAPATDAAGQPGAVAVPSGHSLGGKPIDSPRCRKKLRKIDRLDRQADRARKNGKRGKARRKERKLKRVADNYNRTCRR